MINMKEGYMLSYKKWNGDKQFGFNIRSFLYVFNGKEEQNNWDFNRWLFK